MESSFYSDLDTNFEQACSMCEKDFTHGELIAMLKTGNIPQKQIAALKFDKIENKSDAEVLLSNLTGCDGKVREAVALKLNQILRVSRTSLKIVAECASRRLSDATVDINGNICRLAVDSAVLLKNNFEFSNNYTKTIVKYAKESLEALDKFIFRDKKYVINKQLFKLYWCLDALKYFYDFIPEDELKLILQKAASQEEYTIREKAAEILNKSNIYPALADKLKSDSNYYVRQVFLNH